MNNITEADGWNAKDTLSKANTLRSTYKYDDKNNMVDEKHYDINGTLSEEIQFTYDSSGNIASQKTEDMTNAAYNASFKYTYDFDKKGNWIKQNVYAKDSLVRVRNRNIEYY